MATAKAKATPVTKTAKATKLVEKQMDDLLRAAKQRAQAAVDMLAEQRPAIDQRIKDAQLREKIGQQLIAEALDHKLQAESDLRAYEAARDKTEQDLMMAIESAEVILPLTKLKSANAIAKFLKEQGITGKRGDANKCPIANYLHKNLPKGVSPQSVQVAGDVAMDGVRVNATPAVFAFIQKFDDGEIPELDQRPRKPKTNHPAKKKAKK
jgi:hypothetical protein